MDSKSLTSEKFQRILSERAELLATKKIDLSVGKKKTILIFYIGKEKYAISYDSVEKVIPQKNITPIPYAPKQFLGMFYYNGEIWPVVDAAIVMQVDYEKHYSHVALLREDNNIIALAIDDIVGQEDYDDKVELAQLASEKPHVKKFIQGIYTTDVALIKTEALFDYINSIQLVLPQGVNYEENSTE